MNETLKTENKEKNGSFDEVFLSALEDAASTPEVIDIAQVLESEAASLELQADAVVNAVLVENGSGEEVKGLNEKIHAVRKVFSNKLQKFTEAGSFGAVFIALHLKESPPTEETFFQMKERAKQEMREKGMTMEQGRAYTIGINKLLYNNIVPYAYFIRDSESFFGKLNGICVMFARFLKGLNGREEASPEREDAWRFYLGMPQKNNTFGISDFKPSKSKDKKYYYKINGDSVESSFERFARVSFAAKSKTEAMEIIVTKIDVGNGVLHSTHEVMGVFQWTKGQDERGHYIAYYDKWDLDVPMERGKGFFGQPFEIYDRIYYEPTTFEIIKKNS